MKRGMPRGPWDVGAHFPEIAHSPEHSWGGWFWGGVFGVLLIGLLLLVFAGLRGARQWAEQGLVEHPEVPRVWTEVIRVTLSGEESLALKPAVVEPILDEARAWLEQRRARSRALLQEAIDQETEGIYQAASLHLPAYADWYFSLPGEYGRLLQAALGNLPAYLSDQLVALVLGPAGTAIALDQLGTRLEGQVVGQLQDSAAGLWGLLSDLVRRQAIPTGPTLRVTGTWNLEAQLGEHLGPYLGVTTLDLGRQGVATSAGMGLAAVSAKKLSTLTLAKASTKLAAGESFTALTTGMSKLGLKTAAKVGALGAAGTGAASGAAVCAGTLVGVSVAPGCALVAGVLTGVATWLLVDGVALEAEELLTRQDFEEELRTGLAAQRDDLRATLRDIYLAASDQALEGLLQGLSGSLRPDAEVAPKRFIPARAVEDAASRSDADRGDRPGALPEPPP